jgi:hypothetical protein
MLPALLALALAGQRCIHVPPQAGDTPVTLEGRLSVHLYPGPPNYESVRGGDRPERTYILTLPRPICLDDGGAFADADARFTRVHVYTADDALWPRLRAGIGRRVRIGGRGFAAHTGHHRAPLVVDVREVSVLGR